MNVAKTYKENIINYFGEHPEKEMTPLEISNKTGINHNTVISTCVRLFREGLINNPRRGIYVYGNSIPLGQQKLLE